MTRDTSDDRRLPQRLTGGANAWLSHARPGFLAALLAALALSVAATSAQAYIYWGNGGGAIGRANLDGTSPNRDFITGIGSPAGVEVDGAHLYWIPGDGAIGRANLDGTSPDRNFVPKAASANDIALDGAHIYWVNFNGKAIGRANLDGTSPDPNFIPAAGSPLGVAVDGAHVYWSNDGGGIARANLDGTGVDQSFITRAGAPDFVAVDRAHVYWTNDGKTIGRANLDGTSPDQNFITGINNLLSGVAVDGAHLYWADGGTISSGGSIGRANLDGTGVDHRFFTAIAGSGVAVDALGPPSTPIQGTTVNVVPRKGKVLVRLPSGSVVPLKSVGRQIPVGSTLDTTNGTVRLFAATSRSGRTQHGDFSGGRFLVRQGRKNPLTTLSMTGGGLASCGKVPPGGSPKLTAARKRKRKRRSLFSSVKGHFSVRGRNSASTVRGTKFTMTDTCAGTRTQVAAGTVLVRDFWLRKTIEVKAGHSYLARRGNR